MRPDDTSGEPGLGPPSGTPRWVKVFLIVVIVLALALIVSLVAGVQHGPGLHM